MRVTSVWHSGGARVSQWTPLHAAAVNTQATTTTKPSAVPVPGLNIHILQRLGQRAPGHLRSAPPSGLYKTPRVLWPPTGWLQQWTEWKAKIKSSCLQSRKKIKFTLREKCWSLEQRSFGSRPSIMLCPGEIHSSVKYVSMLWRSCAIKTSQQQQPIAPRGSQDREPDWDRIRSALCNLTGCCCPTHSHALIHYYITLYSKNLPLN